MGLDPIASPGLGPALLTSHAGDSVGDAQVYSHPVGAAGPLLAPEVGSQAGGGRGAETGCVLGRIQRARWIPRRGGRGSLRFGGKNREEGSWARVGENLRWAGVGICRRGGGPSGNQWGAWKPGSAQPGTPTPPPRGRLFWPLQPSSRCPVTVAHEPRCPRPPGHQQPTIAPAAAGPWSPTDPVT